MILRGTIGELPSPLYAASFLCQRENTTGRIEALLVVRKFPLHRHVHGRRTACALPSGSGRATGPFSLASGDSCRDQKIGAIMPPWVGSAMLTTMTWLANRVRHAKRQTRLAILIAGNPVCSIRLSSLQFLLKLH